ncbi:MAG: DUF1848 domain-containing protein [Chloroflexi bacterium]|nr:DUF1848 domain-containing protein [Chloroflexota bacterium]
MIISASYRTDIPAFYGDWFMNRLDAGYCLVENPYNGQLYRVSLRREDVSAFTFWTKNLGPFMNMLAEVHRRGYPFLVGYTITGYPRELESSVVETRRAVEHMKWLAADYGPRVPVWRYDPVLFTSLTTFDFHRENFERLCAALEGVTDEVVISFTQIYQKTRRNTDWAARRFGFTWENPPDEIKAALAAELAQMAAARGVQLTICGQPEFAVPGTQEARCIDAGRLSDIAGYSITAGSKSHRAVCGCHASRDIGAYDTCPHGCVYCYAVQRPAKAKQHYRQHNPFGEFLVEKHNTEIQRFRDTERL